MATTRLTFSETLEAVSLLRITGAASTCSPSCLPVQVFKGCIAHIGGCFHPLFGTGVGLTSTSHQRQCGTSINRPALYFVYMKTG